MATKNKIATRTARALLSAKAVALSPKKPYTWASGIRSPIYCDNRLLLSFPEIRRKIVADFVKLIEAEKLKPAVIAGTATAGIPWGALIAEKLKLPFIYVRKSKKEHGKGNQIEGQLKRDQKVLVIEDLISTGGSSIDCARAVKKAGGKVLGIAAIFSYELKVGVTNSKKSRLPFYSLTSFSTLVDEAVRGKYIAAKDQESVLKWSEDPAGWWKNGVKK